MSARAVQTTERVPLIALLASYGTVHSSVLLFMVALPWFVLETTGSAARTGLATAVHGIPMVLAGIFGGVIVDRLGFRRTAIISDLMSAVAFGMIPLLHLTVGITFGQLLVLVFIGAIFDTPGFTSRLSMMPDAAKRAGVRLERANSISQTLSQGSILLAPAMGGILIGFIGAAPVLFVTTGLLLISVLAVLFFVPIEASRPTGSVHGRQAYLGELKRGFSFLFDSRLIIALMISVTMIQFLRANLLVIMPVYVREYFESAADFGFMFAALGGGGLVSSIMFGIWGHRLPRRPVILTGVSSLMLAFFLLAATPPFWLILVGLVGIGFLGGPMIPLIFTLLQERTPADLRGRVFGLYDAGIFAAMVPGRIMAGYLIEWTGVIQTLLMVGGTYILALFAIFANPHLHRMGKSGDEEPESPDDSTQSEQDESGSGR
ncbi:MAG: MFS transporter [Sphaerobacteraceae bacterium]|nr:MAG: MFS transporter [Sphaerobacteraceae bacterium]